MPDVHLTATFSKTLSDKSLWPESLAFISWTEFHLTHHLDLIDYLLFIMGSSLLRRDILCLLRCTLVNLGGISYWLQATKTKWELVVAVVAAWVLGLELVHSLEQISYWDRTATCGDSESLQLWHLDHCYNCRYRYTPVYVSQGCRLLHVKFQIEVENGIFLILNMPFWCFLMTGQPTVFPVNGPQPHFSKLSHHAVLIIHWSRMAHRPVYAGICCLIFKVFFFFLCLQAIHVFKVYS